VTAEPTLPDNWEWVRLSDIAHIVYGKGLPTKNLTPTGYPVFGANSIIGCYTEYHYESPQLLISCRGAGSGTINFSPAQCFVTNNSLIVDFYVESEVFRETYFYFLQAANKEGLVTGSAQPQVTINNAVELRLPLPPLNEQHRIVAKIEELFSELDKGIESLKTAREQLKVYRQAVLKHAFEGKLTAKWREENADKLEPPEQLLTHIQQERQARYQQQLQDWKAAVKAWEKNGKEGKKPTKPKLKELLELSREELKQLPDLPTGYFYTYLSNLGELGRGKSKHRPRNDPRLFGGRYPFLQTGEVKAANRVVDSYSETYSDFGLEQSRLWSKGTLCITIAANIAETAFLGFDACFPDSVVGFTSLENIVLPEYIELFIKAVRVRIEAYAPATAQKNINLSTLENLVVPLCSLEEQRQLIGQLEAQFSAINENESEITAALLRSETLRQSILKKAFSGQLVPQDTNDEPASILLERIRTEKAVQSKANSKRPAKQGH
tara:strand:+ start:3034 stop:4518 length:1485 start_codon:yes stop_codon:yes gene_type:complete